MWLANFDRKEHLQHRAVSLRQHGFLVQMVDVTDPAAAHSLLQNAPDRVVNRIEIQAVWWPVLRPDEVRRLGRQQCNRFVSTVSRGIVLWEREERSRY